eukprot:2110091-Amphidinium_carterae.2
MSSGATKQHKGSPIQFEESFEAAVETALEELLQGDPIESFSQVPESAPRAPPSFRACRSTACTTRQVYHTPPQRMASRMRSHITEH